jgi:hypothetical protein
MLHVAQQRHRVQLLFSLFLSPFIRVFPCISRLAALLPRAATLCRVVPMSSFYEKENAYLPLWPAGAVIARFAGAIDGNGHSDAALLRG